MGCICECFLDLEVKYDGFSRQYNLFMEEKKAEISNYLRTTVSPFVTPLMEELVKKRPGDILLFTKKYVEGLICNIHLT